jgi:hypothetical protein
MHPSNFDLAYERQLSRRKSARLMILSGPEQFQIAREVPSPPAVARGEPVGGVPIPPTGSPFEDRP